MAYAKSQNVKVYPTAYRRSVNGTTYNPESTLNLECNATRMSTRINSRSKDSYVISYNAGTSITFVIHGYWFRVDNLSLLQHASNKPLYAVIKLVDNNNVVAGSQIENPRLASYGDDNAIVDNLDGSDGNFTGLFFSDDDVAVDNQRKFKLQLLDASQNVPEKSYINISTVQIQDGTDVVPITRSFHSDNIVVGDLLHATGASFGDEDSPTAYITEDGDISGFSITVRGGGDYCANIYGDLNVYNESSQSGQDDELVFYVDRFTGDVRSHGILIANSGKVGETELPTDDGATVRGMSSRAVADSSGNNLKSTYAHGMKAEVSEGGVKAKLSIMDMQDTPVALGYTQLSISSGSKYPATTKIPATVTYNGSDTGYHGYVEFTLGVSGVTAGSYGNSQNKTPAYGDTFKVPYITVNSQGIVTGLNEYTVKIPASDNTTYTFATGDSQGKFSYTPSGGSATQVTVKGLGTSDNVQFSTVKASTFTATTSFNVSSDERLKENVKDFSPKGSILDLNVKEFDYKSDGSHHIGVIAQDVMNICPEIVHENADGYLTLEEGKLVYLLLEEVKKLRKELDEIKGDK